MPRRVKYIKKGRRTPEQDKEIRQAVYVARGDSSPYSNQFDAKRYSREESLKLYEEWLNERLAEDPEFVKPLRGRDLACWCDLEDACHADILLDYANREG